MTQVRKKKKESKGRSDTLSKGTQAAFVLFTNRFYGHFMLPESEECRPFKKKKKSQRLSIGQWTMRVIDKKNKKVMTFCGTWKAKTKPCYESIYQKDAETSKSYVMSHTCCSIKYWRTTQVYVRAESLSVESCSVQRGIPL